MKLKKFINLARTYLINKDEPEITLKCIRLDPAAKLPTKAHVGLFEDAAFDLYPTESFNIHMGQRYMIDTKLSFIIPDGYWIKLRERSGMASKGVHLLGGVIDSGYTGSVKVILWGSGPDPVAVSPEKAICQFTIEKLTKATVKEIDLSTFTDEANNRLRGCNGFGSTDNVKR
jgi:dUTP pyrophosphatase